MRGNVIIFGAGASADAGIPLLGRFLTVMMDINDRKSVGTKMLSMEDEDIFKKAMDFREELDGYHGRVRFNDRNIEDILSILYFNRLFEKEEYYKEKMQIVIKAITRTIDLTCDIKHDDTYERIQYEGKNSGFYRNFWEGLFEWNKDKKDIPTIITFNYDLVLERSLFQILIGTMYNGQDRQYPFKGFNIEYYYDYFPKRFYALKPKYFISNQQNGSTISEGEEENPPIRDQITIEILKLHGSVNFPNPELVEEKPLSYVKPVDNPQIIPPLINKLTTKEDEKIWRIAFERLRNARNIVIVGYSLPKTDIYIQYFFKSALGPNKNLNKITVFDPKLFEDNKDSEEMRERYSICFADQIQQRIEFRPQYKVHNSNLGTFRHFVENTLNEPSEIFF